MLRLPTAVLVAAILLVAACSSESIPAPTSSLAGGPPAGPPRSAPPGAAPVDVVDVLDGDSLRVVVDGRNTELRLLGINAPERDECWSNRARTALRNLLDPGPAALEAVGGVDRFGRVLGYLYVAGDLVNLDMLRAGHALAVDTEHPMLEAFLAAEETAFSSGAGWWRAGACGPVETARVVVGRVHYDAPGPDGDNPSGEWVELLNEGPDAELGGWLLRDESSSHRFTFPNGTMLPAGAGLVIRSGCGADRADELFWCADGPVWSNGGDTVLLLDATGNVVDRLRYSGA